MMYTCEGLALKDYRFPADKFTMPKPENAGRGIYAINGERRPIDSYGGRCDGPVPEVWVCYLSVERKEKRNMSCNWSEHGFGLVLNDDEAEVLRKEVVKKNFPEFDVDMHSIWELPENFETIIPSLCVRYYDEEMDGKSFHSCRGKENDIEYENMLVFWAENQPDAFKAAYGSIEETVKEFRKKIGEYLPDTFDYQAHIGYFDCCVYC